MMPQVRGVVGGPLSIKAMKLALLDTWQRVKDRCVEACTSSRYCTHYCTWYCALYCTGKPDAVYSVQ